MTTTNIMTNIIAEIAAAADAHPRSVERRLLGLPVRGRAGERVDAALIRRGLVPGAALAALPASRETSPSSPASNPTCAHAGVAEKATPATGPG